MSSDLGQLHDADTQGRTAWLCAELAGHNDLRAWVLSTRSKVAFWHGRLRDAINFARRGAAYDTTGTVVLLACQEADAWSELGAQDEALAALARSEDARGAMAGRDEIGGIFACQPARQENYAAAVQLRLGRPVDALRSAICEQRPQAPACAAREGIRDRSSDPHQPGLSPSRHRRSRRSLRSPRPRPRPRAGPPSGTGHPSPR